MYGNLKAEIARKDMTMSDVAFKIGMAATAFSIRVNGKCEWKQSEMEKISEVLQITDFSYLFKK